jgi:hypothetical protein
MLQVSAAVKASNQMDSVISYEKSKTNRYTRDECLALIAEMIKLLEVDPAAQKPSAEFLATQIINAIDRMFNISVVYQNNLQYMEHDIAERIKPVLQEVHHDISYMKKAVLKLCRRIIATIQNYQNKLSQEIILALNRIETLIEEKIVTERDSCFIQTPNYRLYEPKSLQNHYTQYSHIQGLQLSFARSINASTKYAKAAHTSHNKHHRDYLDIITVDPKPIENVAQLDLLFEDALNRLKIEASIYGRKCDLDEIKALIKTVKKSNTITPQVGIKIEKILRPVRAENMHIIYLAHDHLDEHFMVNRAKEAFAIGAQLFLLSDTKPIDAVYSGVEVINSLLDKDVHPDKIAILSRGSAVPTATRIKALFLKQEIDITHIICQAESSSAVQHACICTHRLLNISASNLYTKKVAKNVDCPEGYKVFATYISKQLRSMPYDPLHASLVDIHLKSCSVIQLINLFLKTSQSFIQSNLEYANPALPLDRVRVTT